MKFSYVSALIFSGIVWFVIGVNLCLKGYQYAIHVTEAFYEPLWMILTGIVLGYMKGRFALSKAINRFIRHMVQYEEPLRISEIFSLRYIAIIGVMMTLGILMKVSSIPMQIKAVIDFTVGSALFYGSIRYFKKAAEFKRELPE